MTFVGLVLYLYYKQRKMNKIQKARLVIEGMIFLGIETEKFSELKSQHGGLDGLYNWIENKL